jgi:BirA family biotin operon repressor/biotin-[acetyl-CoA-carboxylase] ligase
MAMERGLHLLVNGLDGLAAPLDAEGLGSMHPIWADAASRFEEAETSGRGMTLSAGEWSGPPVVVCGECTSSLDVARELVSRDALPPWGAVAAVSQRSGRGRLRRPWVSPPGNLYVTVRLPFLPREWREVASLGCGFFAAEALAGLGAEALVKWPNDLLLGGRKLGGILVEERGEDCLAGIGINLAGAIPGFRPREPWSPEPAWLGESAPDVGPLALLAALVKSGQRWYDKFVAYGPPVRFLSAFEKSLAWLNHVVTVHEDPQEQTAYAAKILGLLPDGALLVEHKGERKALRSGSITPK